MSDIRKWFMKQHDKGKGNGSMSKNSAAEKPSPACPKPENLVQEGQETAGRRKTSKYFATDKVKAKEEKIEEVSAKRKAQNAGGSSSANEKPPAAKRIHKAEDDDFVPLASAMGSRDITPSKKSVSGSGRGSVHKNVISDDSDDDLKNKQSDLKPAGRGRGGRAAQTSGKGAPPDESDDDASAVKNTKSGGRGRGGKGPSAPPSGGRGRGGGGPGGFVNFGERKDPPHKGEKEVPEGAPDCLAGLTFVISGTLDRILAEKKGSFLMEEENELKKEKKNIPVLPWMRNPIDITTFDQCSLDLVPFIDPRYSFNITSFNLNTSMNFRVFEFGY